MRQPRLPDRVYEKSTLEKNKCSLAIVWVGGALNKAHLGCTNRLTSTTGTPVCGGMIKHSQTPLSHFCRGCKHCDVSVVLCVSSRCNSAREARNLLSRMPSRNAACRSRGAAPSPARIKKKMWEVGGGETGHATTWVHGFAPGTSTRVACSKQEHGSCVTRAPPRVPSLG